MGGRLHARRVIDYRGFCAVEKSPAYFIPSLLRTRRRGELSQTLLDPARPLVDGVKRTTTRYVCGAPDASDVHELLTAVELPAPPCPIPARFLQTDLAVGR